MKRFLTALLVVMLFSTAAFAAKPKAGDTLPDLEIKDAVQVADGAYLGLPEGGKSFRLSQIKADALVINVFSMYCPRCQADAPAMNKLFERLKASPQGKRIKFLGIGAGNSPFEVGFYRKKSSSPIPMYQDADYALHKQLSNVGTPSFFVLRPLPGGAAKGFKLTFFQEGFYENEDAFFATILNAAGMK
jgi:Redoxin.